MAIKLARQAKRTAVFRMTRTGKSNSVKKVIQATVGMTENAPYKLEQSVEDNADETLEPFTEDGVPKYPIGQIIFDINGEYANPNMQDEGTAIFEKFQEQTTRFSTIFKPDFKVLKVNFYEDVLSGFERISSHLMQGVGNYIDSFRAVDLTEPDDYETNYSAKARHERKVAAYLCCLHRAGFTPSSGFTVK